MHRETKQNVAIKLMKNVFEDMYMARKTLREIKILRKLTRIPTNLFATKLLDVILPSAFDEEIRGMDKQYNFDFINLNPEECKAKDFSDKVKLLEN
jgi:hypothetical protein